ncbi:unnamed protein product [Calicophoron daubneyi]|uniref:Uncharacterized protein n=1 Tax=Calicophoron daubneyi TaxID=300641 RepID=A0AAV2TFM3_CALDB
MARHTVAKGSLFQHVLGTSQCTSWRWSKVFNELLSRGVILPFCSPWLSPSNLIPKKRGPALGFLGDCRALKNSTKYDSYLISLFDQCVPGLNTCLLSLRANLPEPYCRASALQCACVLPTVASSEDFGCVLEEKFSGHRILHRVLLLRPYQWILLMRWPRKSALCKNLLRHLQSSTDSSADLGEVHSHMLEEFSAMLFSTPCVWFVYPSLDVEYDLEAESCSDSSEVRLDRTIWDVIQKDYWCLMDEDIIKECDVRMRICYILQLQIADECDLRKSPNKNSPSLEYCVSHAQNLYSWLQRIKNRVKNRRRIHAEKYATSPFLIELQQNEQRKRALFELISVTILHTVLGDRSTRDAVNDEGTPVNESGVAERDRDTESGIHGLVRLVEQIQREWNDLLVHLQPIDPMEHKQMLFEDSSADLGEVHSHMLEEFSAMLFSTPCVWFVYPSLDVEKKPTIRLHDGCLVHADDLEVWALGNSFGL